ncbi:MAG: hypothetical protein COA78_13675 [Blastopirellula sp.]|nr:MAG: hypothetical protein COA78_13675 [Blastopirellula sp.]
MKKPKHAKACSLVHQLLVPPKVAQLVAGQHPGLPAKAAQIAVAQNVRDHQLEEQMLRNPNTRILNTKAHQQKHPPLKAPLLHKVEIAVARVESSLRF